jgi:hypothetical protein
MPSLPADIDRLIMAALEKDPEQRLPGCQEFLRLLEQVGTQPDGESRRPYRAAWVIGLLVIALLILVWLFRS